jgi:hypothetical protein
MPRGKNRTRPRKPNAALRRRWKRSRMRPRPCSRASTLKAKRHARGSSARRAGRGAKIAGAALDGFGEERAASAIEAAMDALRHQPRLVVKLPPDAPSG